MEFHTIFLKTFNERAQAHIIYNDFSKTFYLSGYKIRSSSINILDNSDFDELLLYRVNGHSSNSEFIG